MAELFWWFEVVKPSFVQPQVLVSEGKQTSVFYLLLFTMWTFIVARPDLHNQTENSFQHLQHC